jgi:hypothetical protein
MVLLGLGDVLTQSIENKISSKSTQIEGKQSGNEPLSPSSHVTSKFDLTRTGNLLIKSISMHYLVFNYFIALAKVTCVGVTTGPFGHYWYSFLDRKFAARTPLNILKKVFCDQLIAAPIFNILFIFALHTLDGKHIMQVYEIFKEKFLLIYTVSAPIRLFLNIPI